MERAWPKTPEVITSYFALFRPNLKSQLCILALSTLKPYTPNSKPLALGPEISNPKAKPEMRDHMVRFSDMRPSGLGLRVRIQGLGVEG